MKTFIIHSLKLLPEAIKLESVLGVECYIPGRDTIQKVGGTILYDNLTAMRKCGVDVYVIWDGQSQGTLFDMGMAYAMGKNIIPHTLAASRSWVSYFENHLGESIRS